MVRPLSELDQSEGKGSEAYQDYVNALSRILANDPEDEELDKWREEDGRVLATQINVAALAGRKRSRISGAKSDFPILSAFISDLKAEFGVKSTTTERLKRQAADIEILLQRLKVARSRLAEAILNREQLTEELERTRGDLERARARRN